MTDLGRRVAELGEFAPNVSEPAEEPAGSATPEEPADDEEEET